MNDTKSPYMAIRCSNCRDSIKPVLLAYDFETALCPDCEREWRLHNDYINSVSQDCAPI